MKITIEVSDAIRDAIRLSLEMAKGGTVDQDKEWYDAALKAIEGERSNRELRQYTDILFNTLCEDHIEGLTQ